MFRYHYTSAKAVNDSGGEHGIKLSSQEFFAKMVEEMREDAIGSSSGPIHKIARIKSPIDDQHRSIIYADYTASGRSLESLESFIHSRVLPWYGNTHSVASGTARQSTHFREEARHIIRNYFNCTESNAVIFTGAGVTGAVQKFIGIIECGVREGFILSPLRDQGVIRSHLVEDRWGSLMCSLCNVRVKNEAMFRSHCSSVMHHEKLQSRTTSSETIERRIHLMIDSTNHHSAMLPFRELARKYPAKISISTVESNDILPFLKSLSVDEIPIAVLSGMSNITGYGPSDDEIFGINEAVHSAGGITAWDLATYASHRRFDMNPVSRPRGYADFAFVSTHKLIGGPGASGLMLARREWLKNPIPTVPGGGVVFFASEREESYIQNSEEREEAGTPDIVGCIRAGLVFSLHSRIEMNLVTQREHMLGSLLRTRVLKSNKICILANENSDSSILSFNILFSEKLFLHHNFIVTVLNDLFGVQVRGGCACAGPFAQRLMGLDDRIVHNFHSCLQQSGQEIFRPGFVRIGVHWTMSEEEVEMMASAIEWIAQNGWRLLSVYSADIETSEWTHKVSNHDQERDWLSLIEFGNRSNHRSNRHEKPIPIENLIERANEALERIHDAVPLSSVREAALDKRFSDLKWFALPSDSRDMINGTFQEPAGPRIIHPVDVSDICMKPVEAEAEMESPPAKKHKKFQVPKKLRSLVTSALVDYSMINPGDKVLIGVSGGKDSLSLLHILLECRRKCPFDFEIACATVDPQVPEYQPQPLIQYMESIGIKYHYLSQPIVELAKTAMKGKQSICAFCSRMKRGMLYRCMRENGYNVLALGQHLDDLVESFLMSCFRNGSLRTMKANYFVKEKDLRVIRPLIYVRERMTSEFANETQLPIIRDNCPACFAAPKERHRIKMLLSNEEYQNSHLFASVLQAMKPLIGISSAMSTRELIQGRAFPIGNVDDEDDDQVAEETLLPCNDGVCPLPSK